MIKLKKGEMTQAPVKSQFGYHIIRLDETREAQFPPLDDVKGQLKQRMEQQKLAAYRDELRAKAKTDYKFSN
jgi:peptidyl-prolyl cis-trans isomerase C